MLYVEKSFPRGGTIAKSSAATTTTPGDKENISFGGFNRKPKKVVKKSRKDATDSTDEQAKSFSAELLSYDTIQDGMLIMGVVKAVDALFIKVALPGGLITRVSALHISDAYTKATREFLDGALSIEHYKPLTDFYRTGQLVYGRVMDIKEAAHGRRIVRFSLKPADVHVDLAHTNINKGFLFMGAIEEVQEHGYIIESGVKGLRAFVATEHTVRPHTVGELIHLRVDKITHDTAASTSNCKEVKIDALRIKSQLEAHLDYILPTSIVQFTTGKHLKDGLQGTIMNEAFTAYINEHQLATPLATPSDYELNGTLRARVLYVMPLTKFVYLTLNMELGTSVDVAPAYKRGDIVEQAMVRNLGTGGVVLQLDAEHKGLISYKTIKTNYKGNYDQDELLKRYAKKTQHKIRILDYDPIDALYRCSDDTGIVDERYFSFDDLQPGAHVTAIVEKYNEHLRGYELRLGRLHGRIEHMFLAPTTGRTQEAGTKLHCRVLGVNEQRHVVYLTNRPEYMAKNSQILTSLKQAKAPNMFLGTVVKNDKEVILVRFFNNIKGLLLKRDIQQVQDRESFYVGQTTQFRIVSRQDEQIILGLPNYLFQMGELCAAKVLNHLEDVGLEIEVPTPKTAEDDASDEEAEKKVLKANDTTIKGLVPLRFLSDFNELLAAKLRLYAIDTQIDAVCINKNIFSLRDVLYFRTQDTAISWQTLKVGDIVKAVVKNIEQDVVELMVLVRNYNKLVRVHWQMLCLGAYRKTNIVLTPEQAIYCRVLAKDAVTKAVTVSAKLTDVWSGKLSDTANYLASYLDEVQEIGRIMKTRQNALANYVRGERVFGTYQSVHETTGDWLYELEETGVTAVLRASMLSNKAKPPEVGRKQECVVLWTDYSRDVVYITNKPADVSHIGKKRKLPSNLVGKSGIAAKVLLKLDTVFICSLKKPDNPLVFCPMRLHVNDFEFTSSADFKEGDFCRLAFVHDTLPIAVLDSTYKLWQQVGKKRKAEADLNALAKKAKQLLQDVPELNKMRKENKTKVKEEPTKKRKKNVEPTEELLFFEDKTPDEKTMQNLVQYEKLKASIADEVSTETKTTVEEKSSKLLPGISDFWGSDLTHLNPTYASSDEDDDDENDNESENGKQDKLKRKSRKSTAVDKFKQEQAEEARLRVIEDKYADPKQLPESVDQFDRLVLSEPNNSKHWINYMVFHLQAAEIDKARAVARRALKAISFREIDELHNVWVALLNLELLYGTQESYKSTLQEALTYNEPLKVYMSVLDLLAKSDKQADLLEIINVMLKKFKSEVEVWRATAEAYFSIGMADRAQALLQKAIASLPEREHINIIVCFAGLNHKFDHKELAHTLLDQIVTSYPKRVDIWTQYVDMLIKDDLIDSARMVLDRAISQVIPLKKMRTLFKKYLEFEERFGTADDVEKVKRLATAYVKKSTAL